MKGKKQRRKKVKRKNDLDNPLNKPEPRDSDIIRTKAVGVSRFKHVTDLLAHAKSEGLLTILLRGIKRRRSAIVEIGYLRGRVRSNRTGNPYFITQEALHYYYYYYYEEHL